MRKQTLALSLVVVVATPPLLTACTSGSSSDSVTGTGGVSVAYVRRPVGALGNPTDSVRRSVDGGDLIIRDFSSPSGTDINVTGSMTLGHGDVSDPEVSYDGKKIIFSMRCSAQSAPACYNYKGNGADGSWNIWEYDIEAGRRGDPNAFRRIIENSAVSSQGDDVDPVYYPDGRIVFVSNRQTTSSAPTASGEAGAVGYATHDEYERESSTVLHIMNGDGSNIKQISFNQSHDRNPIVLSSGQIVYSRWDHVGGRNQFSIFKINPDGTDFFVLYGAHSPSNSYLHPREMPDGRIMTDLMPLQRTREGGSLEIIDVANYSENNDPAVAPGPVNALGTHEGQYQVSRLLLPGESVTRHESMRERGISPLGRYSAPYPLWDGTNRALVMYTPSQPTTEFNTFLNQNLQVEGTPKYGIWMVNLNSKTLNVVIPPQDGYFMSDPIPLQARTVPNTKSPTPLNVANTGAGMGILNVKSVYDTDGLNRMGGGQNGVLASGESIPPNAVTGRPDIAAMKLPGNTAFDNRVARFFRITKAVATPAGLDRETIGESEFEMQQIIGYGVIEPDGSFTTRVPANTPVTITALDSQGRGFTHHTNWIQVREGEERTCNGCHSPRRITVALNSPGTPNTSGVHPLAVTNGETMAETRFAHVTQAIANLGMNPDYQDFWTPQYNAQNSTTITAQSPISITYDNLNTGATHSGHAIPSPVRGGCTAANWSPVTCSIVINYEDQIQPIWTGHCASCHSGATPAGKLDLSDSRSAVFNRYNSYEQLMVGALRLDNTGRPIINIDPDNGEVTFEREPAIANAGNARSSKLIERLFEQPLKAGSTVCTSGVGCTIHAGILNSAELRLVTEWIDLGGQYYNDPFSGAACIPDGAGGCTNARSSANLLSTTTFASTIEPILMANCASCHQAFGGNGSSSGAPNPTYASNNRFVLTGNVDGDFNITASMVTNVCVPANSYLLMRPSKIPTDTPPHPAVSLQPPYTAVLPLNSTNYNAILSWISAATASASCPP